MKKKHQFFICLFGFWLGLNLISGIVKANGISYNINYEINYVIEPTLNQTCDTDDHLFKYGEWTACNSTSCQSFNHSENITCPNGCDYTANTCNVKTYEFWVIFIIVIVVIIFILKYGLGL